MSHINKEDLIKTLQENQATSIMDRTYTMVISDCQRELILTALAQSQMHGHYGADKAIQEEANDLLKMIDTMSDDLNEETIHNLTA
jgi:hypothetical protein